MNASKKKAFSNYVEGSGIGRSLHSRKAEGDIVRKGGELLSEMLEK